MRNYDKEYFIKKLSYIPKRRWAVGKIKNFQSMCVLGHCGQKYPFITTIESEALIDLLAPFNKNGINRIKNVYYINDNTGNEYAYLGDNPKDRIINALKLLQENEK